MSVTKVSDSMRDTTTLDSTKLSGNLPAVSGANLTALNASNLGSGTVPTARLGSGTASSSTFLRGDQTYAAPAGGADTSLSNLATAGDNKVAQAWVDFNGTGTVAIRDHLNVSSLTDHGTGLYSVNFASAMASTNYACAGMAGYDFVTSAGYMRVVTLSDTISTSAVKISTTHANTSTQDLERVNVIVFGD